MDKIKHQPSRWALAITGALLAVACTTSTYDWRVDFIGNDGEEAEAAAMVVDEAGNTYVTGLVRQDNQLQQPRWFINKYDPNGNTLWTQRIDGTVLFGEEVRGRGKQIQVAGGDLYVLGSLAVPGSSSSAMSVAKYNTDGTREWVYQLPGFFLNIDFDVTNNAVYLAGSAYIAEDQYRLHTLKLGADASVLWHNQSDYSKLILVDVKADSVGGTFVTFRDDLVSTVAYTTETGSEAWEQSYSVTEKSLEFTDTTLDTSNNLYAVGHEIPVNSSSAKAVVYKIATDGMVSWNVPVNHSLFYSIYGKQVAWSNGQVFAAVNGAKLPQEGDVLLAGINDATGVINWKRTFNGGVSSIDTPSSLKLTENGEPVLLVNSLIMVPVAGGYTGRAHITHADGSDGPTATVSSFNGADVGIAPDGGLVVMGNNAAIGSDLFKVQVYKFPAE